MRVLVTGADGQLGRALRRELPAAWSGSFLPHSGPDGLDVTDPDMVQRRMREARPDWVVHAGAMTDVDACERDEAAAMRVNGDGTRNVAEAAAGTGARVLYVSTDYVFDGEGGPYTEDDAPRPIQAYGRSKLAGEQAVQDVMDRPLVARTSVVFGPDSKNFVTWLMAELGHGRGVRIVEDQWVSPTYTHDLARQLVRLIEADAEGIYHTAGADRLSRLEMAYAVADHVGAPRDLVTPIRMADLDWVAPRPRDASLATDRIRALCAPMHFTDALAAMKEVAA